jgi:hypothetical protein
VCCVESIAPGAMLIDGIGVCGSGVVKREEKLSMTLEGDGNILAISMPTPPCVMIEA